MSGIVGFVCQEAGLVSKNGLLAMMQCLAHRATDGQGHWFNDRVGLGHLMLHTTPEALSEKLPLRAYDDLLVLTADMRLDNRDDLISRLGLKTVAGNVVTDSALILAAYERWGEQCPKYLLGDFAFALWDARQQQLFCARDHFGIKPFYYYNDQRFFAFASEIKALFALPDIPRQVNELRVAEFLSLQESEGKRETFYQDIMRLPPGHWLTVKAGKVELRCYWQLDPLRELSPASDAAYAEEFNHLFSEAVRCRLRGMHPVGSILSGGLDSAAITCVARQELRGERPLHTLSAYFTGEHGDDERPYIDAIVQQGGVIPHAIDGAQLGLGGDDLRHILRQQDEPFYYAFLLALWPLYRIAQQQGVRVLLDGVDGDSVVAHSRDGYLFDLVRGGRWRQFATELHGWARHDGLTGLKYWRRMVGHTLHKSGALIMPNRFLTEKQHWCGNFSGGGFQHLLQPDVLKRTRLLERMEARNAVLQQATSSCARQQQYRRLVASAFPYHMEMLNRAASAFGLEYRHPFFDKRLVEFCLALPAGQKFSRGQTRAVMRRALQPLLPPNIYARPGKGGVTHRGYAPICSQHTS